ncbi:helix-turn-helix domain-containing protein [Micromonospora sp. NPDC050397]|uniref:helix-turn-helix domain-containing protein n=1 Tax=Micromonospora sp. NPDC050397 TaxID=3364279 RepID=UPI00384D7B20
MITMPSIGDNLARLRRRAGFTQENLAERSTVSVSVIRKLERGDRDSASLPTLRKLATALDVTTVALFHPVPRFAPGNTDDRDDLYVMRRVLQPARALSGGGVVTLADDEDAPSSTDVWQSVREINGMFRDSDYAAGVAALPTAITYARAATSAAPEPHQATAWEQLAQTYQTAAMILIQLRKDDLAYYALGLAIDAAHQAGSDMLVASAVCSENWLLTRQARFNEAERAALATAEAIEPSLTRSPQSDIATWGWLNLGAAAAATRNNRMDVAMDSLRRARAAAHVAVGYRSPHVTHWTTFSPAVVAMREVELAMVTGDAGRALKAARSVPSSARPAITYQRFRLDVAAAHIERRHHDEALDVLLQLRATAAGWLRYQRYAHTLTSRLLRSRARAIPLELRDLADFLDVSD